MEVFYEVPFLAVLEKRKDLLPENPSNPPEDVLRAASTHLRTILYGKPRTKPVHPSVFFTEANLVAFSPSSFLWERFARHYALLAVPAFERREEILLRHYPPSEVLSLKEFLSVQRPFPELKLYHLEVSGGKVYLGRRAPLFQASLLYRDILRWISERVRNIVVSGSLDDLRETAQRVLAPPSGRKRGYPHIQRLLNVTGLPDGRKRVLFYWLIPYWVTVEGKTPEEVLELANEWISRQGGAKIYSSWILSEAENVRSKGIKPWSVRKVEQIDPELVKLLRGMGAL